MNGATQKWRRACLHKWRRCCSALIAPPGEATLPQSTRRWRRASAAARGRCATCSPPPSRPPVPFQDQWQISGGRPGSLNVRAGSDPAMGLVHQGPDFDHSSTARPFHPGRCPSPPRMEHAARHRRRHARGAGKREGQAKARAHRQIGESLGLDGVSVPTEGGRALDRAWQPVS